MTRTLRRCATRIGLAVLLAAGLAGLVARAQTPAAPASARGAAGDSAEPFGGLQVGQPQALAMEILTPACSASA